MPQNNFFPSNLKYLRNREGMTQAELAAKIDVDQTTIGRWEDGNREPTIGNVANLANLFQVDITDFLDTDMHRQNYLFTHGSKLYKDLFYDDINNLVHNPYTVDFLYKCSQLTIENQKKINEIVELYLSQQPIDNVDENENRSSVKDDNNNNNNNNNDDDDDELYD